MKTGELVRLLQEADPSGEEECLRSTLGAKDGETVFEAAERVVRERDESRLVLKSPSEFYHNMYVRIGGEPCYGESYVDDYGDMVILADGTRIEISVAPVLEVLADKDPALR